MTMQITIQEMLRRYSEKKNAGKFLNHDRTTTLGASEVGGCIRKAWYHKHHQAPDEDYKQTSGAADRGNLIEDYWIVPAILSELPKELELLMAGEKQQTLKNGMISATPDGLLHNKSNEVINFEGLDIPPGECVLLEFKSIDPRAKLDGPRQHHVDQVQVQMGLVGREVKDHDPMATFIVYVDASVIDELTIFNIKPNAEMFNQALIRALKVFNTKSAHLLAPEGSYQGNDCLYCPYVKSCGEGQLNRMPEKYKPSELTADQEAELCELILTKTTAQKLKKLNEVSEKEAAEAIKQWCMANGITHIKEQWGKVSWSQVKGKRILDKERIASEFNIDLDDYMKEGASGDRLVVSI